MVDITAKEDGYQAIVPLVPKLKAQLFDDAVQKERIHMEPKKKNEAFATSAQIQYVVVLETSEKIQTMRIQGH